MKLIITFLIEINKIKIIERNLMNLKVIFIKKI
jgi:hypothetical protein